MKKATFISRFKLLKEKRNSKKILLQVSSKLKGRNLFPKKIENAQDFFRKLEAFPGP